MIITIGGGKGGIGKSTTTTSLGACLAHRGHRVGFIDVDLGGANLHHCLGISRPRTGLQQFLAGQAQDLARVSIPTSLPNSWFVSGLSDAPGLANPTFGQKVRLIGNIKKMKADYILVDLGAGSDTHVTDFFAAFSSGLVVTDGLPASIENAYGYLKNGIVRGLFRLFPGRRDVHAVLKRFSSPHAGDHVATIDELLGEVRQNFPLEAKEMKEWLHAKKLYLVLNMVKDQEDITRGKRFVSIVKKYLGVTLTYIGYVVYSPEMRNSMRDLSLLQNGGGVATVECFEAITSNLIALTRN